MTVTVVPPPEIRSFAASPQTIQAGATATLSWEAEGATTLRLEPGIGDVADRTAATVTPGETTTYTLVAANTVGGVERADTAEVTVRVTAGPPPVIDSFWVAPDTIITRGDGARVRWAVRRAASLSIGPGVGDVTGGTAVTVTPGETTTYTLVATNTFDGVVQTDTAEVRLTVVPPPAIDTFWADPAEITQGSSSRLNWEVTGADSLFIGPGVGVVTDSTGRTVRPQRTTVYTLTATNAADSSVTKQTTVQVERVPVPPVIQSFDASAGLVDAGARVTLSWNVLYEDRLEIDPGNHDVTGQTNIVLRPTANTTYRLTASNADGTVTSTVSVRVRPVIDSFRARPATIQAGQSSTLSWVVLGANSVTLDGSPVGSTDSRSVTPDRTTTYTLIATSPHGADTATVRVTVTSEPEPEPHIVSFSASPGVVDAGEQARLSWDVLYADELRIDQGVGEVTGQTSIVVNPTGNTLYTLTASNDVGTVTDTVSVWVRPVIRSFTASPGTITAGDTSALSWGRGCGDHGYARRRHCDGDPRGGDPGHVEDVHARGHKPARIQHSDRPSTGGGGTTAGGGDLRRPDFDSEGRLGDVDMDVAERFARDEHHRSRRGHGRERHRGRSPDRNQDLQDHGEEQVRYGHR